MFITKVQIENMKVRMMQGMLDSGITAQEIVDIVNDLIKEKRIEEAQWGYNHVGNMMKALIKNEEENDGDEQEERKIIAQNGKEYREHIAELKK